MLYNIKSNSGKGWETVDTARNFNEAKAKLLALDMKECSINHKIEKANVGRKNTPSGSRA